MREKADRLDRKGLEAIEVSEGIYGELIQRSLNGIIADFFVDWMVIK